MLSPRHAPSLALAACGTLSTSCAVTRLAACPLFTPSQSLRYNDDQRIQEDYAEVMNA